MYSRQGAGYFHDMLMRLFDQDGVAPQYLQHVTQIHSMLGLVRAGLAAAVVPQSATGLHPDDVQFRALATTPEHPVELHMAWRRDNANPALEAMRKLCLEEMFGPASLLVRCKNLAELTKVVAALEGQLTIAVHAAGDEDLAMAERLMPIIARKAGRVLFNGFGTGVEVSDAMVHGGPFPATSDGRSTSVGSLAIQRFLRPVCYQDVPDGLLPMELRSENALGLPRRIDGARPQ